MKKRPMLGLIANATAMSGGDWEMIAPYGDHPTADRKKIQRFNRAEAEAMVATFNSVWHRLGTAFRGVPVFHGHPDVDPKSWTDDRRLGKIVELEAREDGLWGRPEWNALGADNVREGWWLYPSPAWLHPRTTANVVQPDELLSVGLVNTPNIAGSRPWANSAEAEEEDEISNQDDIMKERLCALYGLDPATATDEEIFAAVEASKMEAEAKANAEMEAATAKEEAATATGEAEAARLKMEEANAARDAAVTRATETVRAAAEVLVNGAITAGRLTEAERETAVNSFLADGADFKAEAGKLAAKETEMNTGHLNLGGKKIQISDSRQRHDAIQAEVNSRMTSKGLTYEQAYQQVKKDPQFVRLFQAMKQPGEAEG